MIYKDFGSVVLVFPVLLYVAMAFGQTTPARNTAVEEEIIQLETRMNEARLRNDVEGYNRYFSEDSFSTDTGGGTVEIGNKRPAPVNVTLGGARYESNVLDDVRVRVYGDAAVSTSRRTVKASEGGEVMQFRLRQTTVWIKQKDGWKIVATHATAIP